MKIIRIALLLALALLSAAPAAAQTETPPLELQLSRTFGYGGIGQIQGTFTLKVANAEQLNLTEVAFLMDGQQVHRAEGPPFEYRFNTGDFPPGMHTMAAVGTMADGRTPLESNAIRREFLSAEAARQATGRIIVPILIGVGALTLAGLAIPALLGRRSRFKPGSYGVAGGAICPRCRNPYARHVWAPNLVVGKLERCPHCGKWAIVPRASPAALAEAEARLLSEGTPESPAAESDEDRLRRLLDESRFEP